MYLQSFNTASSTPYRLVVPRQVRWSFYSTHSDKGCTHARQTPASSHSAPAPMTTRCSAENHDTPFIAADILCAAQQRSRHAVAVRQDRVELSRVWSFLWRTAKPSLHHYRDNILTLSHIHRLIFTLGSSNSRVPTSAIYNMTVRLTNAEKTKLTSRPRGP